jgi:hypothetical protein
MKRATFVVLAALCIALAGCSQRSMIDKLEPKTDSAAAKTIIDQLRKGDIGAVAARLDPRYRTPDITRKLHEIAATFPASQPISIKTVGFHETTHFTAGAPSQPRDLVDLAYEYQFHEAWVAVDIVLAKQGNVLVIEGLHTQRLAESLEASHAFTLKGKDVTHWLMALLTCAEALLCLYAFVLCLRTPIRRRKWLWALFTLVGVTTLQFNWNNGQFAFQPLSAQLLFGVSATAVPYGPWILSVSIPLGAIWFLARRRYLLAAAPVAPPPMPHA